MDGEREMKAFRLLLSIVFLSLLAASVSATPPAWNLGSGYDVTSNYHGIDVPLGTLVTVTAATTDVNVQNVTFVWKLPDETIAYMDPEVPVQFNGNYWTNSSGTFQIFEASSSHTADVAGDWGVQALFMGPGGHLMSQDSDIIAIRATSFNVIPEIPIVGTAGLTAIMLLGLGAFWTKRKRA